MWCLCESSGRRHGWPARFGCVRRCRRPGVKPCAQAVPLWVSPSVLSGCRLGAAARWCSKWSHLATPRWQTLHLSNPNFVCRPGWSSRRDGRRPCSTPATRYLGPRWYRPRSYCGSSALGCLPGGRRVATGGVACAAGDGASPSGIGQPRWLLRGATMMTGDPGWAAQRPHRGDLYAFRSTRRWKRPC